MTIGELLDSIATNIYVSVVAIGWFFEDMYNKVTDGNILDLSVLQGIVLLIPTLLIFIGIKEWLTEKWDNFGIFLEDYCEGKWITPQWIKFIVVLFLYATLLFGLLFLIVYFDTPTD